MNIENTIFKKYSPNFDLFIPYGFKLKNNKYHIEKLFLNNQFKAIIEIDKNGKVSGTVFDIDNNDEFLPLRIENPQGAYVGEVKDAYEKILQDICNKCFAKNYFIYTQSNRITNLIKQKYGDEPEFLWEQFDGSAIFRNKNSNKWYAAILNVEGSKIAKHKKGTIEVIDLKLSPEHAANITQQQHYYKGYHMNKKFWISIILDNSVSDAEIMKLIEESYSFTEKRKK